MNAPGPHPHRIYREQQVSAMGPGPLVLLGLETAIRACRQKRRGLLTRVLHELIAGLDLEQGDVAGNLLVLYEYLLHLGREGRLDEAEPMLNELRDTWERAMRQDAAERSGSARPSMAEPALRTGT